MPDEAAPLISVRPVFHRGCTADVSVWDCSVGQPLLTGPNPNQAEHCLPYPFCPWFHLNACLWFLYYCPSHFYSIYVLLLSFFVNSYQWKLLNFTESDCYLLHSEHMAMIGSSLRHCKCPWARRALKCSSPGPHAGMAVLWMFKIHPGFLHLGFGGEG